MGHLAAPGLTRGEPRNSRRFPSIKRKVARSSNSLPSTLGCRSNPASIAGSEKGCSAARPPSGRQPARPSDRWAISRGQAIAAITRDTIPTTKATAPTTLAPICNSCRDGLPSRHLLNGQPSRLVGSRFRVANAAAAMIKLQIPVTNQSPRDKASLTFPRRLRLWRRRLDGFSGVGNAETGGAKGDANGHHDEDYEAGPALGYLLFHGR